MHGTRQRFRHTRILDGRQHVVWASGEGELLVPVGSAEYWDLLHDQLWKPNFLANQGEADMLDVYFDDQDVRTSLFLRLYNDTVEETDTLATITGEVTGDGYGPITVTRGTDWSAPTAGGGTDMATKTFTAEGAWTDATFLVVATVGTGTSGLLIAANALSETRTLADTDTLDIDLNVTLE